MSVVIFIYLSSFIGSLLMLKDQYNEFKSVWTDFDTFIYIIVFGFFFIIPLGAFYLYIKIIKLVAKALKGEN